MLGRGRLVYMYYEPAGGGSIFPRRIDGGPHFAVSQRRCDEIQREAPHGLKASTFRVVRDYGTVVDLEWV